MFLQGVVLISVVDLTAASGINHVNYKLVIIYTVNNAVMAHTKPEQIVAALERLDIAAVWQPFNSVYDPPPLVEGQTVNKFFGWLFDDESVHQASPHSRLHSSRVNASSFSGSFW